MNNQAFKQTLPIRTVQFLVYRQNSVLYNPSGLTGVYKRISCNMEYQAIVGINGQGEELPIPTTTVPPAAGGTSTGEQSAMVYVPLGKVWVKTTQFGDSNFKTCVKVKDLETSDLFYVDLTSFNANIASCNFVVSVTTCPSATTVAASSITNTTATVSWVLPGGTVGVEYVNGTSNTAPSVHGTFLPTPNNSVALTGLIALTTYYFWVRTICPGGVEGSWVSGSFVTT